jgi:putative protease
LADDAAACVGKGVVVGKVALLNSQALEVTASKGLKGVQLCMEADRTTLSAAVEGFRQPGRARGVMLGLTVFGCPPLFTSRLAADHFTYGKTILSPKNEPFIIEKRPGYTQTRPTKPFSLLPYRRELEKMGLDYLVVDLSGMKTGRKELEEVARHIARSPKTPRLPTFNFLGSLE